MYAFLEADLYKCILMSASAHTHTAHFTSTLHTARAHR